MKDNIFLGVFLWAVCFLLALILEGGFWYIAIACDPTVKVAPRYVPVKQVILPTQPQEPTPATFLDDIKFK